MGMDINEINLELTKLAKERERLDKEANDKRIELSNLEIYKTFETDDEFITKATRKKAESDSKRIIKQIEKAEKSREIIVDREVELIKEKNLLFIKVHEIKENISLVNTDIRNHAPKIREFEDLISRAKNIGTSEEIIDLISKQYQDLIKEQEEKQKTLENLKYEGLIIFDKSKKKEEPVVTLNTNELEDLKEINTTQEIVENEIKESVSNETDLAIIPNEEIKIDNVDDDKSVNMLLADLDKDRIIDPNESINENNENEQIKESEEENNDKDKNKTPGVIETIKVGAEVVKERAKAGLDAIKGKMLDVTEEAKEKMKKRPKYIKNIPNWLKSAGKNVIAFGIVAITYLMTAPYIGDVIAPAIGAASTIGKGR